MDNATHHYEVMFMVQKLSIQNENITKSFGFMFHAWLTLHSMQQVLSAAWQTWSWGQLVMWWRCCNYFVRLGGGLRKNLVKPWAKQQKETESLLDVYSINSQCFWSHSNQSTVTELCNSATATVQKSQKVWTLLILTYLLSYPPKKINLKMQF